MLDATPFLFPTEFPRIRRSALDTFQVKLGCRRNQSCVYGHVDSGPQRTEVMYRETLSFFGRHRDDRLDLTKGVPKLNPLRYRVEQAVGPGGRCGGALAA